MHELQSSHAIVHLKYDPTSPPPCPDSWTRFVCISDTHSGTFPVPDGNVLLHGGDLTETGTEEEFNTTMEWLYSLPHPTKIIIAGNHDLTLHKGWYDDNYDRFHGRGGKQNYEPIHSLLTGPRALQSNLVYLENQVYNFQVKPGGREWTVYGSPWSPDFYNWAFNYNRGDDANTLISKFPQTDILLTHGPPHKILDEVIYPPGKNVGCEALRAAFQNGALKPRLHVFGHIHEAHGAQIDGSGAVETVHVNASSWPVGRRPKRVGKRIDDMGIDDDDDDAPFQPVIVDLLDHISE